MSPTIDRAELAILLENESHHAMAVRIRAGSEPALVLGDGRGGLTQALRTRRFTDAQSRHASEVFTAVVAGELTVREEESGDKPPPEPNERELIVDAESELEAPQAETYNLINCYAVAIEGAQVAERRFLEKPDPLTLQRYHLALDRFRTLRDEVAHVTHLTDAVRGPKIDAEVDEALHEALQHEGTGNAQ